jgi:hypothetical protein
VRRAVRPIYERLGILPPKALDAADVLADNG